MRKYLALIFSIASIAPFLVLGLFAQPFEDDFFLINIQNKEGFWGGIINYYFNWGGRVFSIFLLNLSPLKFHLFWGYKSLIILGILLFNVAVYQFFSSIFGNENRISKVSISGLFLFLLFFQMKSPYEWFYWETGYVAYVLPLIFSFFGFGSYLKFIRHYHYSYLIKSAFFLAFACLSHELFALINLILLSALLLNNFIKFRKFDFNIFILLLVAIICFLFVFLAPGNEARKLQNIFQHTGDFWFSTKSTLIALVQDYLNWTNNLVLFLCLLLWLPTLDNCFKGGNEITKGIFSINPFFGMFVWGVIQFAVYFSVYWSTGDYIIPVRVQNLAYFVFLIGFFYSSSLVLILIRSNFKLIEIKLNGITFSVISICLIYSLKDRNIREAYYELFSGQAKLFDKELNLRYELLRNSNSNYDVRVKKLTFIPLFLGRFDITEDSKMGLNKDYAEYFGVKSIVTE
jgi:hypothetical protein